MRQLTAVAMIPFIDLAAQQVRLKPRIDAAIQRVLAHGAYVMGPEVRAVRGAAGRVRPRRLRALLRQRHRRAGPAADGLGDRRRATRCSAPRFTFAATPEVIPWTGATPVFVDILPDTYNLDPDHLEAAIEAVKAKGELRPAAVIAVDLFGQPADYPRLAADLPPPRPEADRRLRPGLRLHPGRRASDALGRRGHHQLLPGQAARRLRRRRRGADRRCGAVRADGFAARPRQGW